MGRFFLSLAIALSPAPALAQIASPFDDPPPEETPAPSPPTPGAERWDRPFSLVGNVGFGAPTGLFGLSFEATPARWFTLETGAGLGVDGPQLAMTPRLRLPLGGFGVSFGAGVSAGPRVWSDRPAFDLCIFGCPGYAEKRWDRAVRANFELSLERRFESGLQARTYFGLGRVLNRSAYQCTSQPGSAPLTFFGDPPEPPPAPPCDDEQGATLGYVGGSLGYAF